MSTTTLSSDVTVAIARAAQRISDWTQDNNYVPRITVENASRLIAEELASILAAPATLTQPAFITASPRQGGCIGTRYCHACRISYGGTCLCMPNRCHVCSAECGTTPPAAGQTYEHRMHY